MKKHLLVVLLILTACGARTPFGDLDGFKLGDTAAQTKQKAKLNGIVMNVKHLSYRKLMGDTTGYVRMVLDDHGKVRAMDMRGIPCKQPDAARAVVFTWKAELEGLYGPASPQIMSHPNFDVVNYVWRFSDATIYLGTTMKDFRTIPRALIIRNKGE